MFYAFVPSFIKGGSNLPVTCSLLNSVGSETGLYLSPLPTGCHEGPWGAVIYLSGSAAVWAEG